MQTSIIIPTYNRPNDLQTVLNSIIIQTVPPKEVIIVDDSSNEGVKSVCTEMSDRLQEKNIDLLYIRNNRERSSAIARNIGIEHCTGNIAMFLDDDVILEKKLHKTDFKTLLSKM